MASDTPTSAQVLKLIQDALVALMQMDALEEDIGLYVDAETAAQVTQVDTKENLGRTGEGLVIRTYTDNDHRRQAEFEISIVQTRRS